MVPTASITTRLGAIEWVSTNPLAAAKSAMIIKQTGKRRVLVSWQHGVRLAWGLACHDRCRKSERAKASASARKSYGPKMPGLSPRIGSGVFADFAGHTFGVTPADDMT